jgi:uncharacterized protein YkwD
MTRAKLWALTLLLGSVGCGGSSPHSGVAVAGPSGPMRIEAARAYMVELVNRDRAEHGVSPLALDATATRAAQRHARDMATHGFTAHWGTDGSVPEQRYSEAGGVHMAQENAFCVIDGGSRPLESDPVFLPDELENLERAFIKQIPPNDSHRRNVLNLTHNELGVGLARPVGVAQPCMAQLFIDAYGVYEPLPASATVGQRVIVGGELADPVEFGGVGVARLDPARPLDPKQLASLESPEDRTYRIPDPHETYFPPGRGFESSRVVDLEGRRFSVEVALDDRGLPGRYEVSIWGRHPGSESPAIVSLRTIDVRAR